MNQIIGNGAQQVQVNPIECARNALQFLSRVSFTRAERQAFDQVEGMLAAISDGQVIVQAAPQARQADEPAVSAASKPRRPRKLNGHGREEAQPTDQQSPLL
jgi:hypothetical protein